MFAKLKNNFNIDHFVERDKIISFGLIVDEEFQGIEYKKVVSKHAFEIFNTIPAEYRRLFDIQLMKINREIPPHTDSKISCAINFFIKTKDCVTKFYNFGNSNPDQIQIENQTNGFIFNEKDLIWEGDSFTAKSGEAWVLDVTKPHSVHPVDSGNPERIAITLATKSFTFDQVCMMLRATNNL
jgi:hypothetical protein